MKIESIETIPIRVPLPFTYKGSYYKMRNRCTIITRVRTASTVELRADEAPRRRSLVAQRPWLTWTKPPIEIVVMREKVD